MRIFHSRSRNFGFLFFVWLHEGGFFFDSHYLFIPKIGHTTGLLDLGVARQSGSFLQELNGEDAVESILPGDRLSTCPHANQAKCFLRLTESKISLI